jgi:hypothetical protein
MAFIHNRFVVYRFFDNFTSSFNFETTSDLLFLLLLVIQMIFTDFVADYIVLYKTRILFRFQGYIGTAIFVAALDIIGSLTVSLIMAAAVHKVFALMYRLFTDFSYDIPSWYINELSNLPNLLFGLPTLLFGRLSETTLYSFLIPSTLFTSIWTILILLSTTALGLLRPQRFTGWFFDVDKHPVKAIGIASAVLVMVGSLLWSAIRGLLA